MRQRSVGMSPGERFGERGPYGRFRSLDGVDAAL
jgi:hypothetical protein